MTRGIWRVLAVIAVLMVPGLTWAQDDSRDDEIFGAEETRTEEKQKAGKKTEEAGEPDEAWPSTPADGRDEDVLGSGAEEPDLEKKLLDIGTDRLQIGGLLYLRSSLSITDSDEVEDHRFSMPNLLDIYLDARPNDRIRAFVRGRLSYDPTVDESSTMAKLSGAKQVNVALDELWLKLDVARRLFITIGQQKIRWGTTRLWNPIDVVNNTFRPLLDPFDARHGVPLVKLHLPIESLGWNFYAVGVLDRVTSLDRAGVAARAEFVFSTVEAALTGAYRDGLDPALGLDFSAGIWDFDLMAEIGLKFDDGATVQAAVGLQYSISVFDKDMLIIGGEYFFNQQGSDSVNPMDLYTGKVQYFYAGRHYAGLSATLPRPGNLDDWTFTVSTVGNLSDLSFITRFDVSVRVLTYLSLRAYFTGHLGKPGELVLGDLAFPASDRSTARMLITGDKDKPIPSQLFDLGLWMSVDL